MKRINSFKDNKILYLVASPIGNIKEVSDRVKAILNEMDYIAAEDTRVTGKLLNLLNIKKPIISCHEHNEKSSSLKVIELINSNKKVAYLSDAGMPLISDPGNILVKEAIENNIAVSPISGPSAFIDALVCSGLECKHFYFHGFLDAKEKIKKEELRLISKKKETLIFYESPHRIDKTLQAMYEVLGNRKACIARELTKVHEEFIRGTLEEFINISKETLKGEMVIIVEGDYNEVQVDLDSSKIIECIQNFQNLGFSTKDAINKTSKLLNVKKNKVYSIYHQS